MKKHNHITRDIKSEGICPACDEYHEFTRTKNTLQTVDKFKAMSDLELSKFIHENKALVKKTVRNIKKNEVILKKMHTLQIQSDHYNEVAQNAFDCGDHSSAVKNDNKYLKLEEKIKKMEQKLFLV